MANETSARRPSALAIFAVQKPFSAKGESCHFTMPAGGKVTTTIGKPVPESSFKMENQRRIE
jgi:hypothetical protein